MLFDIGIIGAGAVGSLIARELARYELKSRPPNGMTIPYIIRNEIAKAVANGKMVRFVSGGKQYSYLMPTNSSSKN